MNAGPWVFHPDALSELDEAGRRYEEGREGIGEELVDAVYEELSKAAALASPGVVVPGIRRANVRRLLMLPRFPYAVILQTEERVVVAVAHLRKRPNYWRARLPARPVSAARKRPRK